MKLHMHPVSMTSRPVRLFIAENGIEVDEQLVDLMTGEHYQELEAEFDLLSELTALADEAQLKCRQLHGRYLQQRAALATVASGLCQPARKASRVRERAVV